MHLVSTDRTLPAVSRGLAVLVLCLTSAACPGIREIAGLPPRCDTLFVAPATLALVVGDSAQVLSTLGSATGQPASCANQNSASWSSDAPSIASVSPTGLVRAIAPGSTRLRAAAGDRTASVTVRVTVRVSAR